jgi:hypothetical protein
MVGFSSFEEKFAAGLVFIRAQNLWRSGFGQMNMPAAFTQSAAAALTGY